MIDGISTVNEEFLNAQLAEGGFADRTEIINAALDLLRSRADFLARIETGCRQLDAGEFDEIEASALPDYFAALMQPSSPNFTGPDA